MSKIQLKDFITDTKDFPADGVTFRDISPLLKEHFAEVVNGMGNLYSESEWKEIDYIAGIESRGFIFAAALALHFRKGLVMIRKRGKLPNPGASLSYTLEYGNAVIEMHNGQGNMMIVDDVLATGGTISAAQKLASNAGFKVRSLLVLIDLKLVQNFACEGIKVRSLIEY